MNHEHTRRDVPMASPSVAALAALGLLFAVSTVAAQAPEAEEPPFALPTYVLEIEDLEAETVEAGLPEEQDLLPPERTTPLPAAGELEVSEPSVAPVPPAGDAATAGAASAPFFLEGTIGAGTLHTLVSRLAIYRPGAEPRVKLTFVSETADGFGGNEAGAGFHSATNAIGASLELASGDFDISGSAAFSDLDVGLQSRSSFASRVLRATSGGVHANWQISELFRLAAEMDASATTVLLTQQNPDSMTEYELAPRVGLGLDRGAFHADLDFAYSLAVAPAAAVPAVHWLEPTLGIGIDLPKALAVAAEVGWHHRIGGPHLVPFSITVSGSPLDPLWFRLKGGYRVLDVSRGEAFAMDFSLPSSAVLEDQQGWFGEALLRVSLLRSLLLSVGMDLDVAQGVLTRSAAVSGATGLYAVEQMAATELSATAGFRWDITKTICARAEYTRSFMDRPRYEPSDVVKLDLSGTSANGKLGAGIVGRFEVVPESVPTIQIPRLDLSGSFRFSPNARVVAEVADLLLPLTGAPRTDIGAYVEPGFSASLRLLVSL